MNSCFGVKQSGTSLRFSLSDKTEVWKSPVCDITKGVDRLPGSASLLPGSFDDIPKNLTVRLQFAGVSVERCVARET